MPRRNERKIEVRIVSDASQFDRGFQQASRSAQSLGNQLDTASRTGVTRFNGSIDIARSRLTSFTTGVIGVAAVMKGAQKAIDLAASSIKSFSDLNESANAVAVSFGSATEGINQLGEASAENLGLAQSEFNGLAVSLSAFAKQIAGDGGDVVDVIDQLTTRGSDFASVMNLEVSDALEKFRAGLAGETEPLRPFGVDLSAATVKAYAYANGIASVGSELTEVEKVQARFGALLEQTAQVQGDFANTSDQIANRQRILQARFEDTKARLGEELVPAFESFLDVGDELVVTLEQLAPVLNQLGVSFASLAGDAEGPLVTFIEFLADVPRSLQIITSVGSITADVIGAIGDRLNIFGEIETSFSDIGQAIDDSRQLRIEQGFVDQLRDGADAAVLFTNALVDFSNEGAVSIEEIQRLASLAGLDDNDIGRGITTILDAVDAGELDLDRQALVNLNRVLDEVRGNLGLDREVIADPAEMNRFAALGDMADTVDVDGRRLDENLDKRLKAAAETASKRVEDLQKAIESARANFEREISLFAEIELPEEVVSPGDQLANLQQQADVLSRFNDAIGTLAGQGFDNVVAQLVAKGPTAVGEAEALAGDLTTAFDIEQQLQDNLDLATEGAIIAAFGDQDTYAAQAQDLGAFLAANVASGFADNINLGPALTGALGPQAPTPRVRPLEARASGGRVDPFSAYLVGERQPEVLLTGAQGGYVYPSTQAFASSIVRGDASGSGSNFQVNVSVDARGATDPEAVAYATRRAVSREIRNYEAGMDRAI